MMNTQKEKKEFLQWMNQVLRWRVATACGFFAVVLGAFGAHGLEAMQGGHQSLETWKTAVFYHLTHSLLLLFLAHKECHRQAWCCLAGGVLLFSGSLYVLVLTGIKWLGMITPLGGLLLLVGWLLLFLNASCWCGATLKTGG